MRYVTIDENKIVYHERKTENPFYYEIQSDIAKLGQKMLEDGTFVDVPIEPTTPQPTLEDKVNYLYYKSIGVIQ